VLLALNKKIFFRPWLKSGCKIIGNHYFSSSSSSSSTHA